MKISIILPNFNHAAFITHAFDSLFDQTYKNWQLCVVDDGSTDDSWAIIERYRDRDSRILAEKAPRNRGVNATLRQLLELCQGELMCPLAADDFLTDPRFFELAVAAMQRFPQAALVYGRAAIVDAKDGRSVGYMGSYIPSRNASGVVRYSEEGTSIQFLPPQEALTRFVSHHMFIPGCSLVIKRALLAEVGGYDETLGPQSDYFSSITP